MLWVVVSVSGALGALSNVRALHSPDQRCLADCLLMSTPYLCEGWRCAPGHANVSGVTRYNPLRIGLVQLEQFAPAPAEGRSGSSARQGTIILSLHCRAWATRAGFLKGRCTAYRV